jgi:ubiquinone/menaquinone biosynthesis C-methylase UbiE
MIGVETQERVRAEDIERMNYNELIGLVRETNRPPGGLDSIVTVAQHAFIRQGQRILEIGTSTGITAIELARLTGATVQGIDINPASLEEARRRAARYRVSELCSFRQEDATRLDERDESFDLVFCGNVTSLISKRERALGEYVRVLKLGGFVAAIPMYYIRTPSDSLINAVREAIKVPIEPLYKKYWTDFFAVPPLQPCFCQDLAFDDLDPREVEEFVDHILSRPHLESLDAEARAVLNRKYREYMQLFRDNLSHMGYSVMLLRKEPEPMDRELFTAHLVAGGGRETTA